MDIPDLPPPGPNRIRAKPLGQRSLKPLTTTFPSYPLLCCARARPAIVELITSLNFPRKVAVLSSGAEGARTLTSTVQRRLDEFVSVRPRSECPANTAISIVELVRPFAECRPISPGLVSGWCQNTGSIRRLSDAVWRLDRCPVATYETRQERSPQLAFVAAESSFPAKLVQDRIEDVRSSHSDRSWSKIG